MVQLILHNNINKNTTINRTSTIDHNIMLGATIHINITTDNPSHTNNNNTH